MQMEGGREKTNEMQGEAKQKEESPYMMERVAGRDRVMKDGHDRSIKRNEFPGEKTQRKWPPSRNLFVPFYVVA